MWGESEKNQNNYPKASIYLKDILLFLTSFLPFIITPVLIQVNDFFYPTELVYYLMNDPDKSNAVFLIIENIGTSTAKEIQVYIKSPYKVIDFKPEQVTFNNITFTKHENDLFIRIDSLVSDQVNRVKLTFNSTTPAIIQQIQVNGIYDDGILTSHDSSPWISIIQFLQNPLTIAVSTIALFLISFYLVNNRKKQREYLESVETAFSYLLLNYISSKRSVSNKMATFLKLIEYAIAYKEDYNSSKSLTRKIDKNVDRYFKFILDDNLYQPKSVHMNEIYRELSKVNYGDTTLQLKDHVLKRIMKSLE